MRLLIGAAVIGLVGSLALFAMLKILEGRMKKKAMRIRDLFEAALIKLAAPR